MSKSWLNSTMRKTTVKHDHPQNINSDLEIVIGAGFGRTGTSSINVGMNAMGYKCYHMFEVMRPENSSHEKIWAFLYKEKLKLKKEKNVTSFKQWNLITLDIDKYGSYFEELFDKNNYNASVDWPSCMFYLELMEYYKRKGMKCKVLLSIRDSAEQWWNSYSSTIGKSTAFMTQWFMWLIPDMTVKRQFLTSMFSLSFEDKEMNKTFVMQQYLEWIESVKQFVDEDKLLVYNVKQGWTPLVNFLELEIPDKYSDKPNDFIRTNEGKEMKKKFAIFEMVSTCVNVVTGVVVCGLAIYVYRQVF